MATMTFGGHQIGNQQLQFDANRGIMPEVENTSVQIGRTNGERFSYSRFKTRTIPVTYDVSTMSQREFERQMAPLLASDDVQDLIFSDRPDEVWYAKVDGSIDLTRAYYLGTGTINFVSYDGYAHSTTMKSVSGTDGSAISVPYSGTAPTYPIITATMTGDNGFLGFANDKGAAIQFGDPEEVDDATGTKSDRPVRWDMTAAPTGAEVNTNAVTPYANYQNNTATPNKFLGTVAWGTGDNNQYATPSFGTYASGWHGPAVHYALPTNANAVLTGDLLWKARFNFEVASKTMGRMEFTLQSGGKPVLSIVMRDSVTNQAQKIFECWHGTTMVKSYTLNGKDFPNTLFEMQLSKTGDKVLYRVAKVNTVGNGTSLTYKGVQTYGATFAGLSAVAIDGFTMYSEQYKSTPATSMAWTDTSFDWVNETYQYNVPNRWGLGDVVTIDTSSGKVYENGVETDLMTIGNDFDGFAIDEPTMSIEPVVSSWADPAKVTIQYREAWL